MTTKSRTRNIFKYLLIIMVVYASFYVLLFSLKFFLASDYPLVVVDGVSMQPTYYGGDLLLVKGVQNKSTIEIRDIIVFHQPKSPTDRLIVHRVITIKHNGQVEFRTQGDNVDTNYLPDPWIVQETDVVGIVVGIVPSAGSIILAIQNPFVKVFTAAVLVILIVVNVFYDEEKKDNFEGKTPL